MNLLPLHFVFGTHLLSKAAVSESSTRSGMLASTGVALCANGVTYFDLPSFLGTVCFFVLGAIDYNTGLRTGQRAGVSRVVVVPC